MDSHEEIRLRIDERVGRLMEARGITEQDIQVVIGHAEATGEKFVNPVNGRSLASLRPDRVTFWVEYSRVGDEYDVHSAYSHRMEMKRPGI